jgi:hypothetical protein
MVYGGMIETEMSNMTLMNQPGVVSLAVKRLLDQPGSAGSLFGAHTGSVRVREGVDLVEPILDAVPDAESGREIER